MAFDLEIRVIYEDKDLVAINKPAGILVHKGAESKSGFNEITVVSWVLNRYPEIKTVGDKPEERPGIVHRLDKDTSGVLVIARNQKSFEYLKKLFQSHEIKKTYIALVLGKIERNGVINKPIGLRSGTTKRSVRARNIKMIKDAITEYKAIEYLKFNDQMFTLVKLLPKTGRTHQLRVHLASINHAIVGDELYGPKKQVLKINRQFLHAESIEFTKPDGGRVKLEAELPEDLQNVLAQLEKNNPEI
ncbi:MAG: RluA family pseudouridine synthase [Patescibacteria group bacterium]|nr:RluA family pseudouridine synthase [Patescibacteria group bacterium]